MTVHVFPSGQEVADVRTPRRDASRARADRAEWWLVAGVIVTTVVQAGLCVLFWLG